MVTTNYKVKCIRDKQVKYQARGIDNSAILADAIRNVVDACGQNDRENFIVLMLDTKNKIIGTNIAHQGTVNACTVGVKDVLRPAILMNAAAIAIGHNHPSGDIAPSQSDIEITKRIKHACKIMQIKLHDHIIVNDIDNEYYSMSENDNLFY